MWCSKVDAQCYLLTGRAAGLYRNNSLNMHLSFVLRGQLSKYLTMYVAVQALLHTVSYLTVIIIHVHVQLGCTGLSFVLRGQLSKYLTINVAVQAILLYSTQSAIFKRIFQLSTYVIHVHVQLDCTEAISLSFVLRGQLIKQIFNIQYIQDRGLLYTNSTQLFERISQSYLMYKYLTLYDNSRN